MLGVNKRSLELFFTWKIRTVALVVGVVASVAPQKVARHRFRSVAVGVLDGESPQRGFT